MGADRKHGMLARDALRALVDAYGTDNLTDLARLAQMPRQTLANWEERPDATVRGPSIKHLSRAPATAPVVPDLAARLDRIESLLRGLLVLEGEGRLPAVLKAKRKGGGAA